MADDRSSESDMEVHTHRIKLEGLPDGRRDNGIILGSDGDSSLYRSMMNNRMNNHHERRNHFIADNDCKDNVMLKSVEATSSAEIAANNLYPVDTKGEVEHYYGSSSHHASHSLASDRFTDVGEKSNLPESEEVRPAGTVGEYGSNHGIYTTCEGEERCDGDNNASSKSDASWNVRMEELRLYKEQHGDCLVPARYPPNRQLGHWRQYVLMKEDKPSSLSKERVQQLEDLGFAWTVRENNADVWERRLGELAQYKDEHGDCLVPQRYPQNPALGTWVNTQRRHFKLMHDGKRSSMTHDRIRVLETMGFEWRSPKDAAKRKPDGVSRENGMFDMSDQASPGSSGMKRNRMHEQSGMMMLPPGAYGASSGPMSGMPHMPGSAAMQYGGYGAYGPPSVHSQMMYPPAAHGRMQNYPMSMSMNMMQPMGASDGHQQQEQQHFMTGMNGNAASAGQLPLPNQTMTWMCQFCRCSYYGTYMDLRTHEAQCGGWRSYYGSQAGPPQPGHGQTHSANVNVSPNSA